jgi:hypothetical protein
VRCQQGLDTQPLRCNGGGHLGPRGQGPHLETVVHSPGGSSTGKGGPQSPTSWAALADGCEEHFTGRRDASISHFLSHALVRYRGTARSHLWVTGCQPGSRLLGPEVWGRRSGSPGVRASPEPRGHLDSPCDEHGTVPTVTCHRCSG